MKSIEKISICLLAIFIAGSLNLNAQRSIRSYRQDSVIARHDSLRMHMNGRRMQHGMNPWMAPGMRQQGRGMQYGFRGDMIPQGPGRRIMESIPGITEKQKQDLAAVNNKQRDEMQKLMEKNREAMKQLREDHRQKVLNLLTDEQKKWLEEHNQESADK